MKRRAAYPPLAVARFPGRDFDKPENNADLAREIQELWHSYGHKKVRVWLEERRVRLPRYELDGKIWAKVGTQMVTSWEITSNLINALPSKE